MIRYTLAEDYMKSLSYKNFVSYVPLPNNDHIQTQLFKAGG